MTETIKSVGKDRLKVIITILHVLKKVRERMIMLKRDMEILKRNRTFEFLKMKNHCKMISTVDLAKS